MKKFNCKILASLFLMIVLMTVCTSAYAMASFDDISSPPLESDAYPTWPPIDTDVSSECIEKEMEPVRSEFKGTVVGIGSENDTFNKYYNTMTVKVSDDKNVTVRIDGRTQIVDQKNSKSVSLEKVILKAGNEVTIGYTSYFDIDNEDINDFWYPKVENIPSIVYADTIINDDTSTYAQDAHVFKIASIDELADDEGMLKFTTDNGKKYTCAKEDVYNTWMPFKGCYFDALNKGSIVMVEDNFNEYEDADYYEHVYKVLVIKYEHLDEMVSLRYNDNTDKYDIWCHNNEDRTLENGYTNIGPVVDIECETYVPLRKVIEALGPNYYVGWYNDTVFVIKNNVTYKLTHGSKGAGTSYGRVNYSASGLCAVIRDGVTYVPFDWLHDVFGIDAWAPYSVIYR